MKERPLKFRVWDKEAELWRYFTLEDAIMGEMVGFRFAYENACQFTGLIDKNGEEIYDGDIVHVYDRERYCVCNEWEDCEAPNDSGCREHGEHKHESIGDCEQFICTQKVKWSYSSGYFCDEDTGDFCPPLGADEIEMEVIGNIYQNPELLK